MPITQRRMLHLIESAEAFQIAYDGLCEAFARYNAQIKLGELSLQQAWDQLSLTTSVNLHAAPRQTIAIERLRYRLTNKKNEYDRQRKAARRGQVARPLEPQSTWQRPRTAAEVAAQIDAEEQGNIELPQGASPQPGLDDKIKLDILAEIERMEQFQAAEEKFYGTGSPDIASPGGEAKE